MGLQTIGISTPLTKAQIQTIVTHLKTSDPTPKSVVEVQVIVDRVVTTTLITTLKDGKQLTIEHLRNVGVDTEHYKDVSEDILKEIRTTILKTSPPPTSPETVQIIIEEVLLQELYKEIYRDKTITQIQISTLGLQNPNLTEAQLDAITKWLQSADPRPTRVDVLQYKINLVLIGQVIGRLEDGGSITERDLSSIGITFVVTPTKEQLRTITTQILIGRSTT